MPHIDTHHTQAILFAEKPNKDLYWRALIEIAKNNTKQALELVEAIKKNKPDYLLVLPWHFKDFIIKKEKRYLDSGGKLIFPLPQIEII